MRGVSRNTFGDYESVGCYPRTIIENKRDHSGQRATGIALGAAALGVAFVIGWGVNQASKARMRAAEQAAAGNTKALEIVATTLAQERSSRETWQNQHAPTLTQYVDVRAGAGAGAGSNAISTAEAVAAILNGGNNNGQVCPKPVALYQPAMPCRCNTCGE